MNTLYLLNFVYLILQLVVALYDVEQDPHICDGIEGFFDLHPNPVHYGLDQTAGQHVLRVVDIHLSRADGACVITLALETWQFNTDCGIME